MSSENFELTITRERLDRLHPQLIPWGVASDTEKPYRLPWSEVLKISVLTGEEEDEMIFVDAHTEKMIHKIISSNDPALFIALTALFRALKD